jgi:hypothetical protein
MHNQYVINNCPKEKLLVWKIEDGWEPICKFLGKPVPEGPLPHKNRMGGVIQELAESVDYQVQNQKKTFNFNFSILGNGSKADNFTRSSNEHHRRSGLRLVQGPRPAAPPSRRDDAFQLEIHRCYILLFGRYEETLESKILTKNTLRANKQIRDLILCMYFLKVFINSDFKSFNSSKSRKRAKKNKCFRN